MAEETARARFEKRYSALKRERADWEDHWRELSEHIQPRKGRWLFNNVNTGTKQHQKIIDSTPLQASRTLASGMMAGLTSPARPWFRLTTPDPEMMEVAAVKDWLWEVERRMRDVFAKSNLYNALPSDYRELGTFGTAAIVALEDDEKVIRFMPLTIGSYYLATGHDGRADTMYREISMTVRQLVQKFGLENCSKSVQGMFESGHLEQWIKVIHLIEPNTGRIPGMADQKNMPFRSVWYEQGAKEDKFLRFSGFQEFPILAQRWETTGEDVYGYGPGMDALGDCKQLQHRQKNKATAIDQQVKPSLQAPSELKSQKVSGLPGSISYYDENRATGGIRRLYDFQFDHLGALEEIVDLRQQINSAFYADLFLMLAMSEKRDMTATEVAERHEEKLLMLGPVLERLNDELLDPLIDRTFAVMMRRGLLPEPPPQLEGMDLKVEYISILAQAQRMVGLTGIDRLFTFVGNAASVSPSALDKLDIDQSIDEYGNMLGVPPGLVRSDDEVQAMREERARAAQAQRMAEAAPEMARTAKDLSETKVDEEGSALSALMGAVRGAPGG